MKRFISFVTCLLLLAGIPFCAFAEDQPERRISRLKKRFSKHIRTQRLNIAFIRVNSLTACL